MSTKKARARIDIITRRVIRRAGENYGFHVPDDFVFMEALPKLKADITKVPVYVLWNGGELKLSTKGGRDCIACLHRDDKSVIRGWSI